MKLYNITLIGSDGLPYGIRAYQTPEEMEQFERVGIVREIQEIVSIRDVSDLVMKAVGV